ncbi:MAG: SDR family NAD(P)-dependent oxidoreductase, partial [Myxococcales bacterium]
MATGTKTALVTGANKGIGRAIARQLATEGFTVWLGARDAARGQQAVDELRGEGLDVRLLALDVTSDASVAAAARTLASVVTSRASRRTSSPSF